MNINLHNQAMVDEYLFVEQLIAQLKVRMIQGPSQYAIDAERELTA